MPLDDRQVAILRELGIDWWPRPAAVALQDPVLPATPTARATASPARLPATGAVGARDARGLVGAAAGTASAEDAATAAAASSAPSTTGAVPAADLGHLGWDELRDAVAGCRACSLCDSRRQTVFGVGHRHAHWMIVGEAPGEQEDLRGEPFVGAAGHLLDAMLRSIGLTRAEAAADGAAPLLPGSQVYIANTLKCRPPRNRNPEPHELRQCEPFLIRQIELLRPRVIIAMGRFAVQALLRTDEAIGRLRGRVHRYQGVPLIVTYHPAYLLRNLPDKARAWEDLCLALATMEAESAAGG